MDRKGLSALPLCSGLIAACLAAPLGAGELAYLVHDGQFWQAAVMREDGTSPRVVTRSPGDKTRVSWFPDGRELLVTVADGSLLRVEIDSGATESIRIPLPAVLDAVVSPDGTLLAFSVSPAGVSDANHLWLYALGPGSLRQLTRMNDMQHEPSWSRDGRHVYFLSGGGGQTHDLHRVEVATQSVEQLTAGSLYNFDAEEGPDGRIAYSSNRSGNYEIWIQDASGQATRITDHPALDARPTWSPNGETIAFETSRGGKMEVWKMSSDGTGAVRLSDDAQQARQPVWRPAGDAR